VDSAKRQTYNTYEEVDDKSMKLLTGNLKGKQFGDWMHILNADIKLDLE